MTLSNIVTSAESFIRTASMAQLQRIEDSVGAGRNNYLLSLVQLAQSAQATAFVDQALTVANRLPVPLYLRRVVLVTPILLAIIVAKGRDALTALADNTTNQTLRSTLLAIRDNKTLHAMLVFVQNHYGTMCHIATVVSSFVLLYYGNLFFAIPALVVLGVGFLDRQGILPERVRQIIHKNSEIAIIVGGLFLGDTVTKVLTLFNIASYGYNYLAEKQRTVRAQTEHPQVKADLDTIKAILKYPHRLQVNRDFIYFRSVGLAPEVDISLMQKALEETVWDAKSIATLRKKLENDERFAQLAAVNNSDVELIKHVNARMKALVEAVKNHRLLAGEPKDYAKLHNYLKIITDYISKETDLDNRLDILLQIAVQGGEYCGPGLFEAVENGYAQITGVSKEIPFPIKVLTSLQTERNFYVQKLYNDAIITNPVFQLLGYIVDWHDVHSYNQFLNLFGEELGLRKAGADNDVAAVADPLFKLVYSIVFGPSILNHFWRENGLDQMVSTIQGEGTSSLRTSDCLKWWENWINTQNWQQAKKEELIEQLGNLNLFGIKIANSRGNTIQFTDDFIMATFYTMGIVKEKQLAGVPAPLRLARV